MRADNQFALNLFSRLTSFTATEGSDRIENLCTEILAWSLRDSEKFRTQFLHLFGVESPCGGFTIHTQHGFRTDDTPIDEEEGIEPNDADGKRGCYDLVILPELLTSAALIFELKAWSGFRRKQLADYRAAVKKAFPGYADYRILTITPFRDKPTGADDHVPWAAVTKALQESDPTHVVLQQFAQFLTNKKLSVMIELHKLDSSKLSKWHDVVLLQSQIVDLFGLLFANYKELNTIFSKRWSEKPVIEFDSQSESSWIGIYSSWEPPLFYAGFGVLKDDSAVLWVGACVKGDHRKVASALPLDLAVCFKQATQYRVNLKTSANFNELDGKSNTSFDFAQPVDEGYDGQPEKILEWYKDTIMAAHKFGAERCM